MYTRVGGGVDQSAQAHAMSSTQQDMQGKTGRENTISGCADVQEMCAAGDPGAARTQWWNTCKTPIALQVLQTYQMVAFGCWHAAKAVTAIGPCSGGRDVATVDTPAVLCRGSALNMVFAPNRLSHLRDASNSPRSYKSWDLLRIALATAARRLALITISPRCSNTQGAQKTSQQFEIAHGRGGRL